MNKIIQILVIFLILLSLLHSSKSTNDLLNIISNTKSKLEYFFFIKDYKAFLVKETSTTSNKKIYKVWYFTNNRKWKPISNAGEYDGFKLAINHFDKININKSEKTINFGNIINYNNELPYDLSTQENNSNNILSLLQVIENKTMSIGWYFWIKDDESFLFSEDNKKRIKIWHYTEKRKWKPIHNAGEFDGFEKAKNTLKNVKFISDANSSVFYISVGNINTKEPVTKNAFILTIKTDNSGGISTNTQYKVLTNSNYEYNYSVDCDSDGFKEAENLNNEYICEYDTSGTYDVSIEGAYPSKGMPEWHDDSFPGDNRKILDIKQWGGIKWKSMHYAFARVNDINISAKDKPNFNQVKDISYMFYKAESFNQNIPNWDVSNVENMEKVFFYTKFNQDISNWDVSNVKNMTSIFSYSSFNQDISNWDISSVENMKNMFAGTPFNYNISKWDTSSVNNMSCLFCSTKLFNQDISNWDVSNVTDMGSMFYKAESFNQDLTKWKIKKGINTHNMFFGATSMEEKNKPKGIE